MDNLDHIQQIIARLKHPHDFDAIPAIPIRQQDQVTLYLRAVPSELRGMAARDARLMAGWRNAHKTAFFTWITSIEESMGDWLNRTYSSDNQDIIFMLETPQRTPFGHIALYNFQNLGTQCEFGRILRGPGLGPDGGMTAGAFSLLLWAAVVLHLDKIFLEVFEDNKKAISLYQRLGFHATATVPLIRTEIDGVTRWEKILELSEEATVDRFALRMEITSKDLLAADMENQGAYLKGFPAD